MFSPQQIINLSNERGHAGAVHLAVPLINHVFNRMPVMLGEVLIKI